MSKELEPLQRVRKHDLGLADAALQRATEANMVVAKPVTGLRGDYGAPQNDRRTKAIDAHGRFCPAGFGP